MLLHASCIAIDNRAILITGPPGSGKSDLALRLIDGGARLISDDQTLLRCENEILVASAPHSIAGMLEIRHLGLIKMNFVASAPVALLIDLAAPDEALERLPQRTHVFLLDQSVQRLRLRAFEASTPSKIRASLTYPLIDD